MAPRHLVIFGGGISGLTTAFYSAKSLPKSTRITLVEKSHRLGGWIRSLPIANSKIAVEAGPRTFRAVSAPYSLVRLIEDLNLQSYIIATPLGAPASHMRYIYLENEQEPGMPGELALVPPTPLHLPFTPHFRWMARDFIGEFWKKPNTPENYDDESIDSIISRRFSPEIARQLVSAVIHGIYAADSRELSVKSTLPILTHAEREGKGHITAGIWPALVKRKQMQMVKREQEGDGAARRTTVLDNLMANSSTFSFIGGLEMVPKTLEARLSEMGNVEVLKGNGVVSVEKENGDFKIKLEDDSTLTASHVISTLPLPTLHNIMSSSSAYKTTPLPQLLTNPHASVQVLNLVFPPSPTPLHPPGFGFLVPRPRNGYPSSAIAPGQTPPLLQNVIGTAFDSSIDAAHDHKTQPTIMTMMMGGPFPLFQPSSSSSSSTTSSEASTTSQQLSPSDLDTVLRTLAFYLGSEQPLPEPTFHVLHTHRNCIPTYKPGSSRILYEMKRTVREGAWGPRFRIIGPGAGHGVGLADNISLARRVALRRDDD
ncbi:oxygen-dependent protoporphyrinogen oxidase [Tulasnella sp. 427]|nr:oxygen-dependent protoporphyrinogen oxidase [Tulasnella sp. 427]